MTFVAILSLLVGTLPVSFDARPIYFAYLIGSMMKVLFVYLMCWDVVQLSDSSTLSLKL
jgi:hypothetical protein